MQFMWARHHGKPTPILRRRSSVSPLVSILWRVGAVLGLLAFAIAVHWAERDGLKDSFDGHVSFTDVIYFTFISITTTGYGDIVPTATHTRLFDALVVTPIRVFFVLLFVGTTYTFLIRQNWARWQMARLQKTLRDHVVVAGGGTTGCQAVDELLARGTDPGSIVVIDCSEAALQRPEALGCGVMHADATRDETLEAARIREAKAMIICAGRDDTSILITLTAKHLAPGLPVSIAVRNGDNEIHARQAGADTVINPINFAGLLLAGSTQGEHIADYFADLASAHGDVQLCQRIAGQHEVGKPLSQIAYGLGLRIYRGGRAHGFWEPEAQAIMPGDTIIEILPRSAPAAARPA